jgi:hypothetical protein
MNDQKLQVADEINDLKVTIESSGGCTRQKLKTISKGNQTLLSIDKCLARTPDIRVKILENIYEMLSKSGTMYGSEMWGLDGA